MSEAPEDLGGKMFQEIRDLDERGSQLRKLICWRRSR